MSPHDRHRPRGGGRFLLKVGYRCNNRCLFCHAAPHMGIDSTTEEVVSKIRLAADLGADTLVLSGGEPTIRRDLPTIVRAVRAHGLALGLVTNGRMLVYEGLRRLLVEGGLTYLQVSFAGGTGEVHDHVVGVSGAFRQTVQGVSSLLAEAGPNLDATMALVATKAALATLQEFGALVLRLGQARPAGARPMRAKVTALEPEGRAIEAWDDVGVTLTETARALADLRDWWQAHVPERVASLVQEGMPACLDAGVPRSDLWTDRFAAMSEAFEPEYHPIDDLNRQRAPVCLDCADAECPGPFRTYLEQFGDSELEPMRELCGNSSVFQAAETMETPEACPVRRGVSPPAWPASEALILDGQVWTRYKARSEDFGPRSLNRILIQLGQVYEGPSRRGAPFTEAQKLVVSNRCRDCPLLGLSCSGALQPAGTDPIQADEALVARLVGRATGRILDVGCGRAPYLHALKDALSTGRADYTGLDPEPPDLSAPNCRCVQGTDTDLSQMEGPWDWIFSIRALPHYESARRFLERAARLLAPGGHLLLATDVPYVLLSEEPPPPPDRDGFEHRRNPWPKDIVRILEDFGFRLELDRRPGWDTANLHVVVAVIGS